MKVLVIGGAGYVGRLTMPLLAQQHQLRILDLKAPTAGPWEFIQGDVADLELLSRVAHDTDALIYMAVGPTDADGSFRSTPAAITAFDVSVKGLYFALEAAHKAGCAHAVYTSTMSIYQGPTVTRHIESESLPADTEEVYGLTKTLGEEICRFAVRAWGISVNALRLCLPVPMEHCADPKLPALATAGDDVARALLAALDYRHGFEAFMISGESDGQHVNITKAKELLGWEPTVSRASGRKLRFKSAVGNLLRRVLD